jgi:hypothetical protein
MLEVYPINNTCQECEYASTTRGHRLCGITAPGAKHKDEHGGNLQREKKLGDKTNRIGRARPQRIDKGSLKETEKIGLNAPNVTHPVSGAKREPESTLDGVRSATSGMLGKCSATQVHGLYTSTWGSKI